MAAFFFRCPHCRRRGSANKDISGRERACGSCGGTYVIQAESTEPRTDPLEIRIPETREIADALKRFKRSRRFIPERFVSEMELDRVAPVLRVSVECETERRRWKETNGEAAPDPWTIPLPEECGEEYRVPGSERVIPCTACQGQGRTVCRGCQGTGRCPCSQCYGRGCSLCAGNGTLPCAECQGGGKKSCATCWTQGKITLVNLLFIQRGTEHKQRTLGSPSPRTRTGSAHRSTVLAQIDVGSKGILPRESQGWDPEIRSAAEEVLGGLPSDPDARVCAITLFLEQIPTWSATWKYGGRVGRLWLQGHPLQAEILSPPRSAPAIAFVGWVAAVLVAAIVYGGVALLKREGRVEPATASTPIPTPSDIPAPVTEKPTKPKPETSPSAEYPDGILLFQDGRAFRGRVERQEGGYRFAGRRGEERILRSSLDAFIEDGAEHIQELLARLSQCERDARELLRFEAPPPKSLQGLLERVRTVRDQWGAVEPLCTDEEIRGTDDPVRRADRVLQRLRRSLEAASAARPSELPESEPSSSPSTVKEDAVRTLIADLVKAPGEEERRSLSLRLLKEASASKMRADPVIVLALIHSRSQRRWGFQTDRIAVKSAKAELAYEGDLEQNKADGIVLRQASGIPLELRKDSSSGWTVASSGEVLVRGASVTIQENMRSAVGKLLDDHLAAFPIPEWMGAVPGRHLAAAKQLGAGIRKASSGAWAGGHLLRSLAAGHAVVGVREGSAEEKASGTALLNDLGYLLMEDRWVAPPDPEVLRIAKGWGSGGVEGLPSPFLPSASKRTFSNTYPWLALKMLTGSLKGRSDVTDLQESLRTVLALSSCPAEGHHVQSLLQNVNSIQPCTRCQGSAVTTCKSCKGKGEIELVCETCNGHGYVYRAGVGGGAERCPSCWGRPNPGSVQCMKCEGGGKVQCKECSGPFVYPRPSEYVLTSPCALCGQDGFLGSKVLLLCPLCRGIGFLLVPRNGPSLEGETTWVSKPEASGLPDKPPYGSAWLIVLKSGGRIEAEACRDDGDVYTLTLRNGETTSVTKESVERVVQVK